MRICLRGIKEGGTNDLCYAIVQMVYLWISSFFFIRTTKMVIYIPRSNRAVGRSRVFIYQPTLDKIENYCSLSISAKSLSTSDLGGRWAPVHT